MTPTVSNTSVDISLNEDLIHIFPNFKITTDEILTALQLLVNPSPELGNLILKSGKEQKERCSVISSLFNIVIRQRGDCYFQLLIAKRI